MDLLLAFLIFIVLCVIIAWLYVHISRKQFMKTRTLGNRVSKLIKELEDGVEEKK